MCIGVLGSLGGQYTYPRRIVCLLWAGSTVLLVGNPVMQSRIKYFELDFYFVRDKILNKQVEVIHLPAYF